MIASASPGLRESVVDGQTGFLLPHGDEAAMAAAMTRIASSPALVAQLQAEGHRISSVERVEPSLEDVFLDVVERTSA